ncbi:Uncharacterised protein [Mycobacteroides abscessus subsp. abscessus]|nr:Uncharacterised protein [Mycobacteroides abscessus subsp. abscessus]SIG98089.1 Uncharacterised protein [Mycobacteroides abscessus subsp. abscessus]
MSTNQVRTTESEIRGFKAQRSPIASATAYIDGRVYVSRGSSFVRVR